MGHRSTTRVPLLLLAALVLSSCGQGAPTDAFELSGRVTALLESGEEGDAIEGATVEFRSDTRIVETTQTDGSGRYRMRIMTDFPFGQVRGSAEGFLANEETVFFDTESRRVDLSLRRER